MDSQEQKNQSQTKFIQPELYFVRKSITIGGPYSDTKVEVSQLVRKGAILADFPNYQRMKQKGFLRSPMEAGEYVTFAEESYSLVADTTGYPKALYLEQENGPDLLVISITPLIKISHNKMQANLIIHPAIPNVPSMKTEDIDGLIAETGVVFGINREALEKAQQIVYSDYVDFDDIAFAHGIFPGEGVDASVQYELEIGPLAGHIMPDGTIDFRDRRIMVGVKEGQHIATKIPAVPGEAGCNVLGEKIEPKTGRDIKIKVQGEVQFKPEDNKITATKDGALSIVNNDTIKVATKSTIPGDVDYSTGNVESENNTIINGSIQPGFKVNVGGDLEIRGSVSSALITVGGNAVIKGGITGTTSEIHADGDVDFTFIERGTITSGGLIVVRKQSYYSRIEASSDIRCHKESIVLGGAMLAGGNLTVGNVGAENCEHALLAAGVDPERYKLFKQLQKELVDKQEEIIQSLQLVGRGGRSKKIRKMEEVADAKKLQLLTLNLIPGTELYSRVGKGQNRDDLDEEDPMYLQGVDIENIRIEVYGKMFAGTKIMLGNRTATLTQDVENRRYRLSKNLKRIMAIPL